MTSALLTIIVLTVWAGSALLFFYFARGLRLRFAMRHWPRHEGVVLAQKFSSPRNFHGPGQHRQTVTVAYVVDGRRWVVRCGSPMRLAFAHEAAARAPTPQFAVGQTVELRVDPQDPLRAFLYPPETAALLMCGLGSGFLLLFGIGVVR